ncbi:MAG: S1 RNA-binding domain-containing protein [Chloroflexota bacterium]
MDSDRHSFSQPPPPLDEGYWEALLREGEHADSGKARYDGIFVDYASHANGNGIARHATISPDDAYAEQDWLDIETIMNEDDTVELSVSGYNRGGLLVEWRNIRGFVPASQLIHFPANTDSITRRDMLIDQVGKTLVLRVIELNREQNRLVLSERAAQVQPGERAHIFDTLQAGDVTAGIVTNITDFGAFVDLGGLEGLIHISELSWGRVGHPQDVLERDQTVQVFVLDTDRDAGRIALSVKRLHPDPWKTVEERYVVGQIIECHVTNVVDFGAFACVEEGLEGLIHVSELAEGHFLHPRNVVQEDQTVHARILSIDSKARRLGLSLRGLQSDAAD